MLRRARCVRAYAAPAMMAAPTTLPRTPGCLGSSIRITSPLSATAGSLMERYTGRLGARGRATLIRALSRDEPTGQSREEQLAQPRLATEDEPRCPFGNTRRPPLV